MLEKLMTGLAAFVFILAVGMIAMLQQADAGPWCYKTGRNTVQCVGR
jgi:hypothetical protein